MIGFSIEFRRWYITLRGPRNRVYLCVGFSDRLPLCISPLRAYEYERIMNFDDWADEEEFIEELKVKD